MSIRHSNDVDWPTRFTPIPFKKNWPLHIMIVVYVIVWVICAIHPVKRTDWLLDNALLVLVIGMLAFLHRTFAFSNLSYLFITLFLILHTIGAHYTYQKTPFDDWLNTLFHTKREMYDRMVHFAFGLLLAFPVLEVVVRVMKLRSVWKYVVTFTVLLAAGALFEILEMLGALLAGERGEKYLGLQGDPMDSPKDMALNVIGSLLSIGLISWISYLQHRKDDKRAAH